MANVNIVEDDVVISGIGGHFPKSLNVEAFKERLFSNESMLEARWPQTDKNISNMIGKIPSHQFDNSYFGIHRQQCTYMDPMHRLALERTFEALIDAGVNPTEIKGKRIGVFVGSTVGENDNLFLESVVSGFGVTGHSRAMMPNRISYWLNLKGPSVAYDSNWVSGIEVLRLAYNAIKTGQCDSVIVGTANLAIHAEFQFIYNDMGLLSPDGKTRAFDANANGYGRSDGVVMMYIQRASEARRSYASIMHVATRFDGNREGDLLTMDTNNMVDFLEDFYRESPVKAEQIEFVEAYGCGLKQVDETEAEALGRVFSKNRNGPLMIGSVKTQTGHAEASASMFSIVKVLIAMEERLIPANIDFETPNPNIKALQDGRLAIVTQNTKWKGLYAAVNSIGIDSYYGHIVLKANTKEKVPIKMDMPMLLLASTRTETGIVNVVDSLKSKPQDPECYKLIHQIFSKPIQGHLYRGYATLGTETPKQETVYHMGNKRQIWFVYSGMGSQWAGMASDLMKIDLIAQSIKRSHDILAPKGVDLMHILTTEDASVFDNILNCFVGIAAIQIALTDVLKAIGIVPDGIIGHSVGELGCAYADNCMSAEQMIMSAYSRGRASLEATLITGMMAAIGLGYNQIKQRLPPTIEVACHNSPDSCTISGPVEDMKVFVKELQDQGIFARLVNVANIAYHSRYIKPAGPLLLKYLKEVLPQPVARSSKWLSTSNPEENWGTDLAKHSSAEYHTNNLLSSVLFEEGSKHIPKDSVLIEIAPHGLLQAILKRSVKTATNVPLTQRGSKSGVEFLLQSFGKLYLAGLDFDISKLYPNIEYPVSRGTSCLSDTVQWNHNETWRSGVADRFHSLFGVKDVEVALNREEFRDFVGHQMNNYVVLPFSAYVNIIFQILENISNGQEEYVFENLHFRKQLVVPRQGALPIHAMVQKGSGEFEVISKDEILLTGKITSTTKSEEKLMVDAPIFEVPEDSVQLSSNDFYNEMKHRGHKYSGVYKTLKSVKLAEKGSVSLIQLNGKWISVLESMVQQKILNTGERKQDIQLPKLIQKMVIIMNEVPTENTEMQVEYDYATNILTTKGIQIIGMTTAPLNLEMSDVHLRVLETAPLKGNQMQNIARGIEYSIEITLSKYFYSGVKISLFVTELDSDELLRDQIEAVINANQLIQANITSVNNARQIVVQQVYPQLIVVNGLASPDTYKVISSSEAYLLSKTDVSMPTSELIEVAQFFVGNNSYSLMKKVDSSQIVNILVKGDTLSSKDVKRSSIPWVSELYSTAEDAKSKECSIYLITSLIPMEGISNFIQELKSLPNMENLRFIFNLDKKAHTLDDIQKQNLVANIIKQDKHCTLLPFSLREDVRSGFELSAKNIINNVTVKYLGVNLKDETINPAIPKENEVGSIDYSGINNYAENVMGLAYLDETSKIVEDPIFKWTLPEYFTLEDGATIPYAYVNAYYMLMIKARLQPGETVLIHAGCSPIGLAAISIAMSYRCHIYVTVSADWQRAYLKKHFTTLIDHNILSSDDSSFESELLLSTGGRGADVILNCVSGSLLTSSLACIAKYGRFIQYGKYDLEEGNSIGLYCFMKNTSFYAVNLCNVFHQPKEVKLEIKEYVEKGMEDLSVRSILREISSDLNIRHMLSELKDSKNIGKKLIKIENSVAVRKLNVKKPNKFICQAKSAYLIYGGSAENWTDIAEYLVHRGATKIVVASENKPQSNYINRRLSVLHTYYGAEIIMAPNKANTKETASELLSEVYILGPIHTVFTLPNKATVSGTSDTKQVQNIDAALRTVAPKAILINFVNVAGAICQLRSDAGFSTTNVQLRDNDVGDAICVLDDIFTTSSPSLLIVRDKDGDSRVGVQSSFLDLAKILPSVEELVKSQEDELDEPELLQVITEGPLEIRELAPIFIIPGLTGYSVLDDLLKSLLYPTFCAVYPSKPWPLEKLAEAYVEKMRAIYPKGVYNIVSISWGGALAIEIARRLHVQKASLHLFFIDSSPLSIQQAFHQLGEDQSDIEINILRTTLGLNDATLLQKLKSEKDWNTRVKLALQNYEDKSNDKSLLHEGLVCLKNRIEEISAFKPNNTIVSGRIHLIRPNKNSQYDDCGLSLYCNQPIQIALAEGDHQTIIGKKETSDYINKNHYVF